MFYLENHDGSTTNAKYAHEVPSHLFKPFFKKLEQEISDCKSGKGCEVINRNSTQYFPVSRVLFLKHKPTLSMHHLTPSKARLLKNCHSSPEGILAFKTKLSMSNSSIQMQTSKFLRIQINFSKITLLHFPN